MAKQSSKKLKKDQTPFGEESCVNLDEMSISEFRLWSAPALKAFLSIRKRSIEGSFDDLVAR